MKTYTEHIFEELIDDSPEAKIRRYLERKRREAEEMEINRPRPKTREELQDLMLNAINEKGADVDLNYIDVSGMKNMKYLFVNYRDEGAGSDNSIKLRYFGGDISEWNVSNVEDMSYMFLCCPNFNCDISEWDVSNVKYMNGMFCNASKFNKEIKKWDVSEVEDMTEMFNLAHDFNQPIGEWDVSNVKNMEGMFRFARSFNQDISKWVLNDSVKVDDMFYDCPIQEDFKPVVAR